MALKIDAAAEADQVGDLFKLVLEALPDLSQKDLRISHMEAVHGAAFAAKFQAGHKLANVIAEMEAKSGALSARTRNEAIMVIKLVHEKWRRGEYAPATVTKRSGPRKNALERAAKDATKVTLERHREAVGPAGLATSPVLSALSDHSGGREVASTASSQIEPVSVTTGTPSPRPALPPANSTVSPSTFHASSEANRSYAGADQSPSNVATSISQHPHERDR